MRVPLQPAFVLHHRPYRETSVILDLFTEQYGRIAAVARGVRQSRSQLKPLLQPFNPLLISWQGRSELMTLINVEPNGMLERLQGECLLSGLYLNELLVRVLPKHDPHPALYTIYAETLLELQGVQLQQKPLRLFEKKLLEELGYGLHLNSDFNADKFYRFHPEHGFECCVETPILEPNIFLGKSLMALASEELEDENCLRDAKRLMRQALAPLLGQQQLNSRQLYAKRREPEEKKP
jgi:DNA repair protein RecO (recombination protein O)